MKVYRFFLVHNGDVVFLKKIYASEKFALDEKEKLAALYNAEILLIN